MPEIENNGEEHTFSSNSILSLGEEKCAWFLSEGSVNLFIVERKEGNPIGKRTYMATFKAPSLLFTLPTEADALYEAVAITECPCTLRKISLHTLEQSIRQDPTYLHKWINRLSYAYSKEISFLANHYVESGTTCTLNQGETLATRRALHLAEKNMIAWLTVEKGEADFLNTSLSLPEGAFPLTYHAWIKSRQQAVIGISKTTDEWQKGLHNFHTMLWRYWALRKAKEAEEERGRMEHRAALEEASIDSSLKELVTVLNRVEVEGIKIEGSRKNRLFFLACQEAAAFSGIKLNVPEQLHETTHASELLEEIAEASAIRYREVRLRGNWWKKDSGPLLAFYGPDQTPVALLPKKKGGYTLVNPETKKRTTIEEKDIQELLGSAYALYPCLTNDVKTGKGVLSFFWKRNYKDFLPLVFYSVLASLIALFPPFATAVLMNRAIPEANISLLKQVTLGLFVAGVSSSLFLFFRSLIVARLEGQVSNLLQPALWDRLLKLPVSFFRRFTTGNLILRVTSIEEMRTLISGNAIRIIFSSLFSLVYLFAMSFFAPALTVIAALSLAFGVLVIVVSSFFYERLQKRYYEVQGTINAFIIQLISAVGKLRTVGAENNAFSKWAHLYAVAQKNILHGYFYINLAAGISYILPFLMYLLLFGYMISSKEHYTVGAFIAFNTAFVSFYLAVNDMNEALFAMVPAIPLWNRARVIIEEPLEEEAKAKPPGELRGEVQIDEVFFKYNESETYILQNISLRANPQEFIAIVGSSGCGKSTLIRLLLGFEKPHSGAIFYDDKDLAAFSMHSFRRQLGVVLQGEGIIAGSIYDNLTCGGFYTVEAIERALEISGFGEDVASFPMGLHTYLSMGGSTFSGGQRQRLLIARALLPNPKILILDEATSALDNRNQKHIIESIDRLDVTRIVIAHRLSTVRNADRIYVMDKGQFVQVGTYDELAAQPGLFATMLQRQTL